MAINPFKDVAANFANDKTSQPDQHAFLKAQCKYRAKPGCQGRLMVSRHLKNGEDPTLVPANIPGAEQQGETNTGDGECFPDLVAQ